jgi:glycosyltransferase involved in cell wall biosynthesis
VNPNERSGQRTVLIEPLFKQRGEFRWLVEYPPEGYRFILKETTLEGTLRMLAGYGLTYHVHRALMRFLPVNLLKPLWERFKKLPADVDLTYAVLHPIFRPEPWILDMKLEQPYLLIGHEAVFHRWKPLVKSVLVSPFCRRVLFELEAGRRAFLQMTGWSELEPKMAVIHSAVPRRSITRPVHDGERSRVRLLFVNSANITAGDHFYAHGGLLAVEAFLRLRQTYPGLELVVRSSIPPHLRASLDQIPNLRLIDRVLPWKELEREFVAADIFLYPTHVTPSVVLLDAMSYELPIVTTDVWGNTELVKDGGEGLLVHHPRAHEYTDGSVIHFGSPAWRRVIMSVDDELMRGIIRKTSRLIDDPELRRRLGSEGRKKVEHGEFSIQRRNEALKNVLDEAIGVFGEGPGDECAGVLRRSGQNQGHRS